MSNSLNRWQGIGNLGADPEVGCTPRGKKFAKIRIACTESWEDPNTREKRESTEWVNVVAWSHSAEYLHRYAKKGMKVYVEGPMKTRSWEDKNGGGKRYATEVECKKVMLMGSTTNEYRPDTGDTPRPPSASEYDYQPPHGPSGADDDLPF